MYLKYNYTTKKQIKADVRALLLARELLVKNGKTYDVALDYLEYSLTVYQPNAVNASLSGNFPNQSVTLEGPHYPEPHRWYASGKTDDKGILISVK